MAGGDLASVGATIREARSRFHLTQADVARQLVAGVTLDKGQTWVSAVERGSAAMTPRETVLIATSASIACGGPSVIRRQRNHVSKTIGKPCAGKPHARFERGMGNRARSASAAPLTTNDTF
jgi:hypothetical protein